MSKQRDIDSIVAWNPELSHAAQNLRFFLRRSKADNTVRAYLHAWKQFERWCVEHGLEPMPADPTTVALFISEQAEVLSTSTIRLRLTAINQIHKASGVDAPRSPVIRMAMDGIKRSKGVMQQGKAPLMTSDIIAMANALPDTLAGTRDRALLLVGFSGCFRRSELAAMEVKHLRLMPEGLAILVPRSKTDQAGEGIVKGIPYGDAHCPVRAMQAWIADAQIGSGPVFRRIDRHGNVYRKQLSGEGIALIVKRACVAAGLDPKLYAGHSLRSGLATSAAVAGVSEASIVKQGGWRTERMARRYVRDGSVFRDNAAGQLGL